jgi:hypothetical protein
LSNLLLTTIAALGPPSSLIAFVTPTALRTAHSSAAEVSPVLVDETKTKLPCSVVPMADHRLTKESVAHAPDLTIEVEELTWP